jgi:hypothetical protein
VRRLVLGAHVGLQLHDPPDPATVGVIADQMGAEQASRGPDGRAGEDRAIDDAQDG